MGTEIGLPDFRIQSADELIPVWLRQVHLEHLDLDVDRASNDDESDGMSVDVDVVAESPHPDSDLELDVECASDGGREIRPLLASRSHQSP